MFVLNMMQFELYSLLWSEEPAQDTGVVLCVSVKHRSEWLDTVWSTCYYF